MKSRIALIAFAALFIVACGDDSDDEKGAADAGQDSDARKEDSVFGGYLVAIDKAKAAGKAANERQTSIEESLGLESSTETRQTLGMTETRRTPGETYAETDGIFSGMIQSVNKAKVSRDMLNDRQKQIDALSGGVPQSTHGIDNAAEAPEMFAPTVAVENASQAKSEPEGGMFSGIDRAREVKEAANNRHQELESLAGVQSESDL